MNLLSEKENKRIEEIVKKKIDLEAHIYNPVYQKSKDFLSKHETEEASQKGLNMIGHGGFQQTVE